jgi:hypothetical protein
MKPWWILIATALALSVTAPTANAMTVHTDDDGRVRGIPRICAEEVNGARQWATDLARIDTEGVLVLDGREIALRGDAAQWRLRDEVSPDFASRFHSMSWVVLGLHSDIDVVGLLLQREAAAPDPGFAAGSAALQESGWTSGVVRLRMGTVSCVFEATRDERLIPVMDALVNANLDPYRYRGAPVNAVHNQGTLANVARGSSDL